MMLDTSRVLPKQRLKASSCRSLEHLNIEDASTTKEKAPLKLTHACLKTLQEMLLFSHFLVPLVSSIVS